ncbi:MAG: hypothetical protein O9264_09695 [Leptospira sp.]|nr:hypothetical protein [Leptospira sp.]
MDRNQHITKNPNRRWFLLFFLILNQCLLNPVVRDALDLDQEKNRQNFFNSLLLLDGLLDRSIPTATVTPSLGNILLSSSSLKVVFSKTMEPGSLSSTLGTSLSATWTQTFLPNDTATLSGPIPVGYATFVLDAKDSLGQSLTQITGTYLVLNSNTNIYYVSVSGNDSNTGLTSSLPKLTIPATISAATSPAAIFISVGDYNVDSSLSTAISLVEKVSLYGGFSQDFQSRNLVTNISKIQDVATAVVTNTNTINAGASITAVAIMADGASPTVSDNSINGGTSSTDTTFGIFLQNGSSATIKNNTINAGNSPATAAHAIYTGPQGNNPIIIDNLIYGGGGNISYAIYHGTGGGNVGSYQSNTLFTSGGTNRYCLYEAGGGSSPVTFNSNRLFSCPTALYLDQGSVTINSFITINGGTTNGGSYTGNF